MTNNTLTKSFYKIEKYCDSFFFAIFFTSRRRWQSDYTFPRNLHKFQSSVRAVVYLYMSQQQPGNNDIFICTEHLRLTKAPFQFTSLNRSFSQQYGCHRLRQIFLFFQNYLLLEANSIRWLVFTIDTNVSQNDVHFLVQIGQIEKQKFSLDFSYCRKQSQFFDAT